MMFGISFKDKKWIFYLLAILLPWINIELGNVMTILFFRELYDPFGTDYPGFPYVGIARMCLLCTLLGMMLTFITVKSGSVWPAAIMHAVLNAGPSILNGYINSELATSWVTKYYSGIWRIIVMLIIAIICLILLESEKSLKVPAKENF